MQKTLSFLAGALTGSLVGATLQLGAGREVVLELKEQVDAGRLQGHRVHAGDLGQLLLDGERTAVDAAAEPVDGEGAGDGQDTAGPPAIPNAD